MHHFTKTGSGQAWGKHSKKDAFLQALAQGEQATPAPFGMFTICFAFWNDTIIQFAKTGLGRTNERTNV
jgi:hypothetical protein